MTVDGDAIADCVLSTFGQLPEKRKPRPRDDGSKEWVPLAGIVLSKDGKLSCVSLGTGMKCLPSTKLPLANGNVLHDWHAEILAIRSFNRFLLDHCLELAKHPTPVSPWIQVRPSEDQTSIHPNHEFQPFTIRPDVKIHMYCSEAPCGDASMELTMNAQEDATPWTSPAMTIEPVTPGSTKSSVLRGRANFDLLGAVRCKPSRPDAPLTLSKSCTDKLTMMQATSLLSSTTSLLISPRNAYITTLVLPDSQYVPSACVRAFSRTGRLSALSDSTIDSWDGGYTWSPFAVVPTSREFAHSRRSVGAAQKPVPSNLSAVWTPQFHDSLIGGVLQGRKQFDARGASRICRRSMWKVAVQVAAMAGVPAVQKALEKRRYDDLKESDMFDERKRVKGDVVDKGLKGWVGNSGDGRWGLEDEDQSRS